MFVEFLYFHMTLLADPMYHFHFIKKKNVQKFDLNTNDTFLVSISASVIPHVVITSAELTKGKKLFNCAIWWTARATDTKRVCFIFAFHIRKYHYLASLDRYIFDKYVNTFCLLYYAALTAPPYTHTHTHVYKCLSVSFYVKGG